MPMNKLLKAIAIAVALIAILIVVLFATGAIRIDNRQSTKDNTISDIVENNKVSSSASIHIEGNTDIHISGDNDKAKPLERIEKDSTTSGYVNKKDSEIATRIIKPEGKYKGFAYNENKDYYILSKDVGWVMLGNDTDKITIAEDNHNSKITDSLENMISLGGMSNYFLSEAKVGDKVSGGLTLLGKEVQSEYKSKKVAFKYSYYAFKNSNSNFLYASVKPTKAKIVLNIKIESTREKELDKIFKDCLDELIMILK